MSIKKMRSKTHKGTKKRIKLTNGDDKNKGKILVNRINDNHRMIRKSRTRVLKSRRSTALNSQGHQKLRSVV